MKEKVTSPIPLLTHISLYSSCLDPIISTYYYYHQMPNTQISKFHTTSHTASFWSSRFSLYLRAPSFFCNGCRNRDDDWRRPTIAFRLCIPTISSLVSADTFELLKVTWGFYLVCFSQIKLGFFFFIGFCLIRITDLSVSLKQESAWFLFNLLVMFFFPLLMAF